MEYTRHWHGQVSAVVVNTADVERYYQNNDVLGLFDPVRKESLIEENMEDKIDAVFAVSQMIHKKKVNNLFLHRRHLKKNTFYCHS